MRAMKLTSFLLAALLGLGVATGCGAGPQPIDESAVKADTDKAVRARAIFNSSGGDYTKITAGEKAELAKLYGSEANAEKVWALMKNPPNGSGSPAPTIPPAGR